jgi:alkylated DNA repair dioxygenase AlkB
MAQYIINSNGCYVIYIKGWLTANSATAMLNHAKTLPLREEQLFIHGNYHKTPRRVYHCGMNTGTHNYSGMKYELQPWDDKIEGIAMRIKQESGVAIDSCLINEYRDEEDYIGYHSDKNLKDPNQTVVTVSLGASRWFYLKNRESGEVIKIYLEHGDAVVMYGDTQKKWVHSLPKLKNQGYRISLTYRCLS